MSAVPVPCLHFSPVVSSPHVCLCWMMCLHSRCLVSPLSPNVSHCLPACVSVLDGASAFLTSCLSLSPHMCACVGWRVRLPKVSSPLLTPSVPLSALSRIVSPHVCLRWMVGLPSRRVVFPFCLRLSLHMCACNGMSAFSGLSLVCHCLPLSPHMCLCWMVCLPSRGLVSACLPTICVCVGWCVRLRKVLSPLVVFHRSLASMVCPPFQGLVSPGPPLLPILSHCLPACVHLCWMVCPPSRRLVSELSPIVPTCVPVLDGVSAFPKSCLPLSPFLSILVSGCLHVFPIVSRCLQLFPIVSPHVPVLDGPPSRSLGFHCLPLSP